MPYIRDIELFILRAIEGEVNGKRYTAEMAAEDIAQLFQSDDRDSFSGATLTEQMRREDEEDMQMGSL